MPLGRTVEAVWAIPSPLRWVLPSPIKKHGRITININGDGDLNYAPGVLWTAVHHQIPLLTIVHNNRAYHQELMYLQQQANARNRGVTSAPIGTTITDPNIDYAQMAHAYGMHAEGPVENTCGSGPSASSGDRPDQGRRASVDRRGQSAALM